VGSAYFPDDGCDAEALLATAAARQRAAVSIPDLLREELERLGAAMAAA
jgi:hypothetical protein